jgi:L,D-transpeptidase ErfK/SrfK
LNYIHSREDETLLEIAREYDLGHNQIILANPNVNRWIPGDGTPIMLPRQYVLPNTPRKGIVLNVAELRMYFFPPVKRGERPSVMTFPVSLGRMNWKTPIGKTKVISKERNPAWHPPTSIRQEHAMGGDILPPMIPGGAPNNPLGRFALRLGIRGYLIHGVEERKAFGIGMRVTHGCIRMYPEDIEHIFELVPANTPVQIINEPVKLGWRGDQLYVEVHQPFEEDEDEWGMEEPFISTDYVHKRIHTFLKGEFSFDESTVTQLVESGDGVATPLPVERFFGSSAWDATTRSERDRLDDEYQKGISRHLAMTKP